MMTLEFDVNRQTLTKISGDALIANSQKLLLAHFTFSKEWNDLEKIIHFRRKYDSETEERYIDLVLDKETNTCEVPLGVLDGKGTFTIGLYGQTVSHQGINETIITCNEVDVYLNVAYLPTNQLPYEPLDGVVGAAYQKIRVIYDNWDNISAVNDNIENVVFVANNIEPIKNVGDNIEAIKFLATHTDDIAKIGSNIESVVNVSDNINDIVAVGGNILNVKTVSQNISSVNTVADMKAEVRLVALDADNIRSVGENIESVNAIAPLVPQINKVATNIDNVNNVSGNIDKVVSVSDGLDDINIVSSNITAVRSVSNNMPSVNVVRNNIDAIVNISENLDGLRVIFSNIAEVLKAKEYSDNAKIWAEGTDTQVIPLGGEHSAKGWAQHADDIVHNRWGTITGDIENQEDLADYIEEKAVTKKHDSDTTEFGGGTNEKYGHVMLLDDLFTWNNITQVIGDIDRVDWNSIVYAKNKFVVVGLGQKEYDSNGYVVTSSDGKIWGIPQKIPTHPDSLYFLPQKITYGNGKFVAVGGGSNFSIALITTSADGVMWNIPIRVGSGTWYDVVYANGKFVAVGKYYDGEIATSIDGITWSVSESIIRDYGLYGITYGNGKFVAVGDGGSIITSGDGENWTDIIHVGTGFFNSVTYSNGRFFAVGKDGQMTMSADGVTWSPIVQIANYTLNSIMQGATNNILVAVGVSGCIVTSMDNGITWGTPQSIGDSTWKNVTYGNGKFVAVGDGGYITVYERTLDNHKPSSGLSIAGLKALAQTITYKDGSGATVTKKFLVLPD